MRVFAVLMVLPLLAACTDADWNRLMNFGDQPAKPAASSQVARAAPAPAPAPAQSQAQPAPDPFCLAVARQDATSGGFDQATQGRVAIRSYQQCVVLFGASAGK